MEWKTEDIVKALGGGTVVTVFVAVVGWFMGWLRFGKKDTAETKKIEADTAIAEVEKEIKMTNMALKIADQYTEQLHHANETIDKQIVQMQELREELITVKNKCNAIENELTIVNNKCHAMEAELKGEKQKNIQLMKELQEFKNGRKRP